MTLDDETAAEAKKKTIRVAPEPGQAKPTDATLLVNGPYPAYRISADRIRTAFGQPSPSLEALRREFEYRIRTAVTYGLGRGKTGDSESRDVAGWIDREVGAAMASLTVSQVIEAVRQEQDR